MKFILHAKAFIHNFRSKWSPRVFLANLLQSVCSRQWVSVADHDLRRDRMAAQSPLTENATIIPTLSCSPIQSASSAPLLLIYFSTYFRIRRVCRSRIVTQQRLTCGFGTEHICLKRNQPSYAEAQNTKYTHHLTTLFFGS